MASLAGLIWIAVTASAAGPREELAYTLHYLKNRDSIESDARSKLAAWTVEREAFEASAQAARARYAELTKAAPLSPQVHEANAAELRRLESKFGAAALRADAWAWQSDRMMRDLTAPRVRRPDWGPLLATFVGIPLGAIIVVAAAHGLFQLARRHAGAVRIEPAEEGRWKPTNVQRGMAFAASFAVAATAGWAALEAEMSATAWILSISTIAAFLIVASAGLSIGRIKHR